MPSKSDTANSRPSPPAGEKSALNVIFLLWDVIIYLTSFGLLTSILSLPGSSWGLVTFGCSIIIFWGRRYSVPHWNQGNRGNRGTIGTIGLTGLTDGFWLSESS